MTRTFLLLIGAGFAAVPAAEAAGTRERPNILYILADDLGYGDLRVYNPESRIATPRLDALAAEGMRFTDAHSPSSVCTPTRYGVLTGRYCWRSRVPQGVVWTYGRMFLEEGRETVGTLLQRHGYSTAVIGKWHLGLDWALRSESEDYLDKVAVRKSVGGVALEMKSEHIDFSRPVTRGPKDYGFEYSFILPGSLDIPPYCYLENHQIVTAPTATTPGNDLDQGSTRAFWRPGDMAPDFDFDDVLPRTIRTAIAWLKNHARGSKPFFLYLPLPAPHTPWLPGRAFVGTSGAGMYGDFVQQVDASVGQVLDALRDLGVADDTLVIFTSDNGPYWRPASVAEYGHRAAGEFRGMKGDIWEAGHRVPYIARWPGRIAAGSTSGAVTSLTHLMATVGELLKLEKPNELAEDSHSILPVLLGKAQQAPGQKGIVMHSSRAHFAWREGDWKYIERRGSGGFTSPVEFAAARGEPAGQLYHLAEDPGETTNLFLHHPDRVQAFSRALEQERRRGSFQE